MSFEVAALLESPVTNEGCENTFEVQGAGGRGGPGWRKHYKSLY